jgi:23S rRNA (cytidine1920-2'-O)/16S rRNA (cytidine1409-2'-O)-methyltransferase
VLADAAAIGLVAAGLIRSPITGPAGNVEFLAWLQLGQSPPPASALAEWLAACTGA